MNRLTNCTCTFPCGGTEPECPSAPKAKKSSEDIVCFDLDGTLSNGKHRNHLVPKPEDAHACSSWEAHYNAAGEDAPIRETIKVLEALSVTGYRIVILTGRCEKSRKLTEDWLARYYVGYDKLIMRSADDERPDILYKEEELLKLGLDNILCCFDDLEHVATMMRGLGLTCYLVNKYNKKRVNTTDNSEWGGLDG